MRTFIAIKIFPDEILRDALADMKLRLTGEPIKWVDESLLHLTLKFLGDTSPEQVQIVTARLADIAEAFPPVTIFPQELDYFKRKGIPSILFLNIKENGSLSEIAGKIDEVLEPIGFSREPRTFKPHLTLARIRFLRDKHTFYKAVGRHKDIMLSSVTVEQLHYLQSTLTPAGPEYRELIMLPLNGIGRKDK